MDQVKYFQWNLFIDVASVYRSIAVLKLSCSAEALQRYALGNYVQLCFAILGFWDVVNHFGNCIGHFGVKSAEMIWSHRALSSLNMSSYRAI